MISATVVAHSINEFNEKIASLEVVLPRYILAEGKTHRIIKGALGQVDIEILESIGLNDFEEGSKNSASSRAIPFNRMIRSVEENPFIPYAWQKDHSGMQGTQYFEDPNDIETLVNNHLYARDAAVSMAKMQSALGVTKQIVNRYLEPFMWHKVLITATEWENFFSLRCPQYLVEGQIFRSRKDVFKTLLTPEENNDFTTWNTLEWLKANKGMADIHMMFLAEAIWDAINESTPKKLKGGEWHIVYENKAIELLATRGSNNHSVGEQWLEDKIRVTTGMAARASYTVVGEEKEIKWETLAGIHDKMKVQVPFHASPFEHNNKAMTYEDRDNYLKMVDGRVEDGWCRNYKGFIQHRHIIESKL